ncbi:hypothetical protein D3C76_1643620 [compost metagenome]
MQVGATAKDFACAGDEQGTHSFIGMHLGEYVENLTDRIGAERVEPFRLIQRDDCNSSVAGMGDGLIAHAGLPVSCCYFY